jgi:hypothetical protein
MSAVAELADWYSTGYVGGIEVVLTTSLHHSDVGTDLTWNLRFLG